MNQKLLFHPHVTLAAMCATLASAATALATLGTPLGNLLGKDHASQVVDTCIIIATVAGVLAGTGRSPIPSVDKPESETK